MSGYRLRIWCIFQVWLYWKPIRDITFRCLDKRRYLIIRLWLNLCVGRRGLTCSRWWLVEPRVIYVSNHTGSSDWTSARRRTACQGRNQARMSPGAVKKAVLGGMLLMHAYPAWRETHKLLQHPAGRLSDLSLMLRSSLAKYSTAMGSATGGTSKLTQKNCVGHRVLHLPNHDFRSHRDYSSPEANSAFNACLFLAGPRTRLFHHSWKFMGKRKSRLKHQYEKALHLLYMTVLHCF